MTGAAISSAETKMLAKADSAPATIAVSFGVLPSGTSMKVRVSPRSVQASPPMARKIAVPTRP